MAVNNTSGAIYMAVLHKGAQTSSVNSHAFDTRSGSSERHRRIGSLMDDP